MTSEGVTTQNSAPISPEALIRYWRETADHRGERMEFYKAEAERWKATSEKQTEQYVELLERFLEVGNRPDEKERDVAEKDKDIDITLLLASTADACAEDGFDARSLYCRQGVAEIERLRAWEAQVIAALEGLPDNTAPDAIKVLREQLDRLARLSE